ncbi:MAG: preprotein translocase subunit YajC [Paludibacteraceae bacterium]|nr:preprotein translocase subunit YajC [Paludibacteraceae bacterium]
MVSSILLQAAAPEGAGFSTIIMMIAIFAIFYFFMIRPQKKRQEEIKKFRDALQVGDEVVTSGGIHGKIKEINDNTMIVEIANNVNITVDKASIFSLGSNPANEGK